MACMQLLFEMHGREKILRGATALADVVRVTLGPRSKWLTSGFQFLSY